MIQSPYEGALKFLGIKEVPGSVANPQILAMLRLDQAWPDDDKVPWCSAFMNYVCWFCGVERSKSLRARSWLRVGRPITEIDAVKGFDVVILSRGGGVQPGADVINAPGHVGFFSAMDRDKIVLLGGNQNDTVKFSDYTISRVLGIRRLS